MNAIDFLNGEHAIYRFLGQEEDSDSVWMSHHGHPFAYAYRRHRSFFNALSFAGGTGTRYVAFHGVRNFMKFQSPRLMLSRTPSGLEGFDGEPGPRLDSHRWIQYLQAAAHHGWPWTCQPELYSGRWIVRTEIEEVLDDFRGTVGATVVLIEPGYWQIVCDNPMEPSMERLHRVSRKYFGLASLPPPSSPQG